MTTVNPPAPAEAEVVTISIDSPQGAKVWEETAPEVKEHLRKFGMARPGFRLGIHDKLMFDESPSHQGQRDPHRQDPLHPYQAGTIYIMGKLSLLPRDPKPQILDIGSPIETTIAICAYGDVTKIDVRPWAYLESLMPFQSLTSNATAISIEGQRADVIVSNCVMCHVGDGRYGDPLDVDGDVNMLRECRRILKPGGQLILGLGPVGTEASLRFNTHRVYSEEWAKRLFKWAGLRLMDFWAYDPNNGAWHTPDLMKPTIPGRADYYGFATLLKPVVQEIQEAVQSGL